MGYTDFLKNMGTTDPNVDAFTEDVEKWKTFKPDEKAKIISEAKESGDKDVIAYIVEMAEAAKEIKEEEEVIKQGGTDDTAKWSDDDPAKSSKGQVAGINDKMSAVGISSGLGAMNLAKKLRRSQEQAPTPQKSEEG